MAGDREHGPPGPDHLKGHRGVGLAQIYPLDPVGRTAHRAYVGLPEVDGQAPLGADEELVLPGGDDGADEGVPLVDGEGDDPRGRPGCAPG